MSFYAVSALFNAVTSLILGTLLLSKNLKSRLFLVFTFFAYSVGGWSVFYFLWQITENESLAFLYVNLFMACAVFIPFFYFHFVTIFTKQESKHVISIVMGYIFAGIFSGLSFTSYFIEGLNQRLHFEFWPVPGDFFLHFLFIWLVYILYGSTILVRSFLGSAGKYKSQIRLILIGMIVGYVGGITNYFLWYDIPIPPFGNILVSFYVIMVSYAIIKHQLFNLKVVIAEFIVFTLWILALVRLVLSESESDIFYNGLYFIAVVFIGVFLIFNVRKEVKAREEIQGLAKKLEKSNQRLKALDKQKSEFVSIASHQLRSPLTAMRGYASMLTQGSFGKFPKKAEEPLNRIAESARLMAMAIEDYLSVSRIESGNMKYECTEFALPKRVEEVCDGLRKEAMGEGLLLTYTNRLDTDGLVYADEGKVQQILHNLINNSLKYTEKGSISVCVDNDDQVETVRVHIIDTGIGMSEETRASIFQKFQRAKNANSVNVHGTGLGLFVAKKMAKDMHGDIQGFSPGEGKGSHFIFTLPIATATPAKKSGKKE